MRARIAKLAEMSISNCANPSSSSPVSPDAAGAVFASQSESCGSVSIQSEEPLARGLHLSTFRLNVSTFCWIRWVHDVPAVYQTEGHREVRRKRLRLSFKVDEGKPLPLAFVGCVSRAARRAVCPSVVAKATCPMVVPRNYMPATS